MVVFSMIDRGLFLMSANNCLQFLKFFIIIFSLWNYFLVIVTVIFIKFLVFILPDQVGNQY